MTLPLLCLGALGAVALAVAELLPLLEVKTGQRLVATVGVGSHHSYAGLLIAIAAGFALTAAFVTRRRVANFAVLGLGVVALVLGLIGDLPDTHASGLLSGLASAKASPREGLWVELGGGLALTVSALLALVRTR